jgi:hypothetical protein
MKKLAALLVLTAAALGLLQAPAAAAGFLERPPVAPVAASSEAASRVLAAKAEAATPTVHAAHVPPPVTADPPAPPATTAPEAAVLAPALQVAAGEPEPLPERLEVLGEQQVLDRPPEAARAARAPAAPTARLGVPPSTVGLARTGPGWATTDLLALGLGLVALGAFLSRR